MKEECSGFSSLAVRETQQSSSSVPLDFRFFYIYLCLEKKAEVSCVGFFVFGDFVVAQDGAQRLRVGFE